MAQTCLLASTTSIKSKYKFASNDALSAANDTVKLSYLLRAAPVIFKMGIQLATETFMDLFWF